MGERISLLVMLSGVALGLYWLGIPAAWVLVLLVMSMVGADIMLLKERRRKPSPRETPCSTEEKAANSAKEDAMTDYGGKDDGSEPAWKKFSKLRVPVRSAEQFAPPQGGQDQNVSRLPAFTPEAPPPVVDKEGGIRPETPPQTKDAPSEAHEVLQANGDPLGKYPTDQFKGPARPAPVAESIPVVDLAPIRTPTGPAWAPPVARPMTLRESRAPGALRPPRPILKPEDFTRNAGRQGFLYLARNPEHWNGLFKVGQTLRHPRFRLQELNTLHATHKDIGTFELLDVVEVADAYGAEQVLFLVLSDLRPVPGREFFVAEPNFLSQVMRAVSAFVQGQSDALNTLYRELDPEKFPPWPGRVPWYHHHGVARAKGWVYLARSQYHLIDTYLFGATKETPDAEVRKLNAGQRTDTPQIGFYTVVFSLPVWNTKASRTIGWRALAPWRLKGSRSYIRGPLAKITQTLAEALRASD